MSDFMSNFEKQRSDYLEHYGVKGMRWGVINEEQPMGQYPGYGPAQPQAQGQQPYSPEDYRAAIERANEFRKIDEEQLKQRRKEIAKKVIKGVAIGAIVTGLVVGGVKRFGNKQLDVGDHPNPSLGKSFGLYGAKAKEFGRDFKEGWNTNIRENTQARRDQMAEAIKKAREEGEARKAAKRAARASRDPFDIPFFDRSERPKATRSTVDGSNTASRAKSNTINDMVKDFMDMRRRKK